jgi:hypothetical protein
VIDTSKLALYNVQMPDDGHMIDTCGQPVQHDKHTAEPESVCDLTVCPLCLLC